jgi:hypothetical protein
VYGGKLDEAVDARIVRNITWMGQALTVAGAIGTLAFCIATLDEVAYSVAALILGVGLVLGTPALVLGKLQDPNSQVAVAIAQWTRYAGFAMCGIAALRVVYYIVDTIRSGPKARKKAEQEEADGFGPKKVKRTQGVWSACWQLPYCHDTIREACPAYKERKNCWRFGRGCNCDPMMIETMISQGAARLGKGAERVAAQKQVTQDAYLREALGAGKRPGQPGGAGGPPVMGKTIDCKKCPIYGEHQRQKFNIVNPIAMVGTVILLVLAYPILRAFYYGTVQAMAKAASELTLGKETALDRWIGYLDTPAVQVFFFAIVSLFLLSYVLKIVEWIVFVRKL